MYRILISLDKELIDNIRAEMKQRGFNTIAALIRFAIIEYLKK